MSHWNIFTPARQAGHTTQGIAALAVPGTC